MKNLMNGKRDRGALHNHAMFVGRVVLLTVVVCMLFGAGAAFAEDVDLTKYNKDLNAVSKKGYMWIVEQLEGFFGRIVLLISAVGAYIAHDKSPGAKQSNTYKAFFASAAFFIFAPAIVSMIITLKDTVLK